MNNRIVVDCIRYDNIAVEVGDEPVFVLDNSASGGSVTLATLSYVQNTGHYVLDGDQEWADMADVVYIRTPESLGLCQVYLENITVNDTVYTQAVSAITKKPLYTWKA